MHNETAIFVHIPKTAGTTLNQIIGRQVPRQARYEIRRHDVGIQKFKELDRKRRADIRVLHGHIPYGLHKYIPGPATYFTLLRDPIERVLSYYYFVQREPDHYLYDYANTPGMTVKRYLQDHISLQTANFQTRLISGVWTDVGYGECDGSVLALAKKNLAERFAVIGLTERFDETLILLKRRFGWRNVYYGWHNVTRRRPHQESLPAETLAVLRAHNQLDLELYAHARELFERQIQEQGESFARAVQIFQRTNRWLSPPLTAYGQARRFSLRAWLRWAWNKTVNGLKESSEA